MLANAKTSAQNSCETVKLALRNQGATMNSMQRRRIFLFAAVFALFAVFAGVLTGAAQDKRGRKYKAPPPTARIEVTVVRADDGKPVENAAVIFHDLNDTGNMELRSNEDGKTVIDVLPIGKTARLQIIARGFQTFGQDYPVDKANMAIEVRLKRPGQQYSTYKEHPSDQKSQNKNPDNSKPNDSSKPQ